jgi:hypothetical protein
MFAFQFVVCWWQIVVQQNEPPAASKSDLSLWNIHAPRFGFSSSFLYQANFKIKYRHPEIVNGFFKFEVRGNLEQSPGYPCCLAPAD